MIFGQHEGDFVGYSVSCDGDVNADGFADVLVGAPYESTRSLSAGVVGLFYGPVTGVMSFYDADALLWGEVGGREAEYMVSIAGDINGDGFDDVLVGTFDGGQNPGAVFLVYGPLEGSVELSDADAKFLGEAEGDYAFYNTHAGDVNNDGYNDILIGAPFEETGGNHAGAAYLLYGRGM